MGERDCYIKCFTEQRANVYYQPQPLKTLTSNRFSFMTGNFIIATATKKVIEVCVGKTEASQLVP